MRIALVGPVHPYRGGISHYTTMLYRALLEQEHQVLMVSFKRQYPQRLFPGQSDRDPSQQPLEVKDARYWIDSLNPFTWWSTFWRIRKHQPDLVILQWWTTFWAPAWFLLGALTRLCLRRPLLFLCHNVLPHEARWWDRGLARLVLSWGNRFITQSENEKDRLLALLSGSQVEVVPHPVYDMFADQRVPKSQARDLLGVPQEVPILLFFGMVREYKGLMDLLLAFPRIQASLGNSLLLVAGEFWDDVGPYQEMIEELGIGESVRVTNEYIANERVPLYFCAADLLVAPYRRVTGSGVVQMARGFGLPVITTQGVEGAENLGQALVAPGNVQELASAVIRFFQAPPGSQLLDEQEALSKNAFWLDLVQKIEEVLA